MLMLRLVAQVAYAHRLCLVERPVTRIKLSGPSLSFCHSDSFQPHGGCLVFLLSRLPWHNVEAKMSALAAVMTNVAPGVGMEIGTVSIQDKSHQDGRGYTSTSTFSSTSC